MSHTAAAAFCTAPPSVASPLLVWTDLAALTELEHHWLHVMSFSDLTDPDDARRFDEAWLCLERAAVALGMPANHDRDAADWAEAYLRRASEKGWTGGMLEWEPDVAFVIGTPEYRARHISMLWSQQLWHEAIMVVAGAGAIGFLFYAIVQGAAS